MSYKDVQRRLTVMGFDPGPLDGKRGPKGDAAVMAALDKLAMRRAPLTAGPIPSEWLPDAKMDRIIVHWTAGGYKASNNDRQHYHLLVEDDGQIVHGVQPISANQSPMGANYAAHTADCNSGSIGVAVCCMLRAQEKPFDPGPYPLLGTQWSVLGHVVAQLCRRYKVPVLPHTVLSHAEVEPTLGIKQAGKWDIARLPFDPTLVGAVRVGDQLRSDVSTALGGV